MTDAPLSSYLRTAQPHEIKLAGADVERGVVSGYGSTWLGEPDAYGDVVAKNAFTTSLAKHQADGTTPLMLWGHDPDRPVGRWIDVREDQHGLFLKGQLNLDTTAGRDAHAHVKAGDVNGLSIGYRVLPNGAKAGPNGTTILTNLEILETSIVAFPANRRARVTGVKSFSSRSELEEILREHLPGRAVKKLLSGGWPALSGEDFTAEPSTDFAELMRALKAARLDLKGLSNGYR